MASQKLSGCKESKSQQKAIENMLQVFQRQLASSVTGPSSRTKVTQRKSVPNPRTSSETVENVGGNVPHFKTPSLNKKAVKRSVAVERKQDLEVKKARRLSMTESDLKFRCSFCSERFPALVNVRDHIRACHREENECRKEKANVINSTKGTPVDYIGSKPKVMNKKQTLLFRCKACNFASISYDRMIEHCQKDLIKFEFPKIYIPDWDKQLCLCEINGEELCLDLETYFETRNDIDSNEFYTFIECDYKLLKEDEWPGVFHNHPKSEIDQINFNSIYYFTRMICFTSRKKRSSALFMTFQCQKCMKYIDPHSVLTHVQENSCNKQLPEFPCYVCKIPFLNENTMYLHYTMHQAAISSNMEFRTVLFNSTDPLLGNDDLYNALLLKAAGLVMHNTPYEKKIAQMEQSSDYAKTQIEVNNQQANDSQKPSNLNLQNAPSGPKTTQKRSPSDPVEEQSQLKTLLQQNDARSMIIKGSKTSDQNKTILPNITSNIRKEKADEVTTVYKCQCELCFHKFESLFRHLEKCPLENCPSAKISCICGLIFDEKEYQSHYGTHSQGFTKISVKRITVSDEKIIFPNNQVNENEKKELEHKQIYRNAISELIAAIQSVASGLPHVESFKKLEEKEKLIAAPTVRSVSSGTDDLIAISLKSHGTRTVQETPIVQIKSVGTETDVTEIAVTKSISTMTMIVESNKTQSIETMSVMTGTNDLNISGYKSQGTMTMAEAETGYEVSKDVSYTKQTVENMSITSETDDLNIPVFKSPGNIAMTETQIVHEVKKEISTIQAGESKSAGSETDDLNKSFLKSQLILTRTEEQIDQASETMKKFEKLITCLKKKTALVGEVSRNLSRNVNCVLDNAEKKQSVTDTTMEAEINVTTKEKKCEENGNVTKQAHDKKAIDEESEECDKIQTLNKNNNQEIHCDMIKPQTDINDEFKKNIETIDSEINNDVSVPKQSDGLKVYTEEELLDDTPVYYDAQESIKELTDDEDSILLYEEDDIME